MKGPRRHLPGFNAQTVANDNQVVLAAEVITQCGDFQALAPMLESAEDRLRARDRLGRRRLLG